MSNRYTAEMDRTLQNRCPGIGLAYTQVKPTKAEIALKAKARKRAITAAAQPAAQTAPAAWPPGFVSQIRVDKHGRMV
jgi:hypothetical protein